MGGDSQVRATAVGDPPTIDPANSLQLLLAEGIGPSEEDQIRFLNDHIDALQSRINNSSAANHPDPAEDDDGRSTMRKMVRTLSVLGGRTSSFGAIFWRSRVSSFCMVEVRESS